MIFRVSVFLKGLLMTVFDVSTTCVDRDATGCEGSKTRVVRFVPSSVTVISVLIVSCLSDAGSCWLRVSPYFI